MMKIVNVRWSFFFKQKTAYEMRISDGSSDVCSSDLFDTGKYALKPALLPVLDSVARALVQHPELRAKSIGYTDSTGSAQVNQTLSVNRARAVANYLSDKGVPVGHLTAEGRGPSNPVGDNATPEGRAMNRRAEVYLYAVTQQLDSSSTKPG